jgi:hypothetical protein
MNAAPPVPGAAGTLSTDLVDAALAAGTLPGIVIVADRTEANLRWARSAP